MAKEQLIRDIALLSLTTYDIKNKRGYLARIARDEGVSDDELDELIEECMRGEGIPEELKPEWNKYQGRLFEGYMVEKLKETYNFINWTSDKCINGVMAPSASDPDLTFSLFSANDKKFAIECKWHGKRDTLGRFAHTDRQFQKYKTYQAENDIPCFIAIGFGKTGTDISEVYIVPLKYIDEYKKNATNIDCEKIEQFKVDSYNKIDVIDECLKQT